MLFLLLHEHQAIKSLIPVLVAAGTLPPFVIIWAFVKIVTLFLPRKLYRKSDDYLYQMYQKQNMFFLENLTGIKLFLYGDYQEFFNDKNCHIMICNHQSNIDYLIGNMLAARQGSLGHLRYLIRDKFKYLPFFGFYLYMHGCFFKRKNTNEIQRLKNYFNRLDMPSSLILFPEGKKFDKNDIELIAMSHKYAAERELPLLQNVLMPKIKEAFIAFSQLKEKFENVYDVTIAYSKTRVNYDNNQHMDSFEQPSIRHLFTGKPIEVHVHINKITKSDIQVDNGIDEKHFASWLIALFEKKDKMLEAFHSYINSEKTSNDESQRVKSLSLSDSLPSVIIFSASTFFLLSSPAGRKIYFNSILYVSLFSILYMKFKRNK